MPTRHQGTRDEVRAMDAYVKLSRAATAVEASVNRHLAEAGLTIGQFGVLEALWHLGPLPQGRLARKILTSPANLTTVLANLERRGLVRRARDPRDRRVVRVELAAAGEACVAELFPRHVRRVVAAFEPLTDAQQDALGELCRTLGRGQAAPDAPHDAPTEAPAEARTAAPNDAPNDAPTAPATPDAGPRQGDPA